MKSILLCVVLLASVTQAYALESKYIGKSFSSSQLANAIYKAENSKRYPYGIKAINTHGDITIARRVCINTINNNYRRWYTRGTHGDYLEFLAARYCPIGAPDDIGAVNRYWLGNVVKFLKVEVLK